MHGECKWIQFLLWPLNANHHRLPFRLLFTSKNKLFKLYCLYALNSNFSVYCSLWLKQGQASSTSRNSRIIFMQIFQLWWILHGLVKILYIREGNGGQELGRLLGVELISCSVHNELCSTTERIKEAKHQTVFFQFHAQRKIVRNSSSTGRGEGNESQLFRYNMLSNLLMPQEPFSLSTRSCSHLVTPTKGTICKTFGFEFLIEHFVRRSPEMFFLLVLNLIEIVLLTCMRLWS